MPFDAMMLGLAVTVVFLGFAAVLAWADRQTNGLPSDASAHKQQAFKRAA
jgi:hypothetical protein